MTSPSVVDCGSERIVAAACGGDHTLFVTEFGDCYTLGRGREGQLGVGEQGVECWTCAPRHVSALATETVVAVAAGGFHSLAVTASGRVYEWGLCHTDAVASADGAQRRQEESTTAGAAPARLAAYAARLRESERHRDTHTHTERERERERERFSCALCVDDVAL